MSERARLARHVPSDVEFLSSAGVPEGFGEAGFSAFERAALRPSLTVSRLTAGGRRTDSIIPSRAGATVSLRLVADQQPGEVARQLRRHLAARTPPSVTTTVATSKASPPWTLAHDAPQLLAAVGAAAEVALGSSEVLMRPAPLFTRVAVHPLEPEGLVGGADGAVEAVSTV